MANSASSNPQITVDLGNETHPGVAINVDPAAPDDLLARELLVARYDTPTNPLADWKRRSLPVTIAFPKDTNELSSKADCRTVAA